MFRLVGGFRPPPPDLPTARAGCGGRNPARARHRLPGGRATARNARHKHSGYFCRLLLPLPRSTLRLTRSPIREGVGMDTGQYEVRPEAMRSAVGNIGGIIMQTVNAVLDLEKLVLAPTSFAMIGDAVA